MKMLNIGSGNTQIEGYTAIDRKFGGEAFPLKYNDGSEVEEDSVDSILASHCLEHFSHRETFKVLEHWISKLVPGGCIKIAVPDLEWIAKNYLDGKPVNVQGYLMGAHVDGDDHHGAAFDRELLFELMISLGLERIGNWKSEIQDCSALPVSLNLMGFKPISKVARPVNTVAILSAPRYGPISHQRCAHDAFQQLGVSYSIGQGAYWHQVLSEGIELRLSPAVDFVITCDYDTIFSAHDVQELYRLMLAVSEADAIVPVQSMRGAENALFGMVDADGKPRQKVYQAEFNRNLTKIQQGHFGLTIFRAETLRKAKKPWMVGQPNKDGRWGDGRVDPDIDFWRRWWDQGFTAFMANRVVVGHSVEALMWPGRDMKPVYQNYKDYLESGIPAEVLR